MFNISTLEPQQRLCSAKDKGQGLWHINACEITISPVSSQHTYHYQQVPRKLKCQDGNFARIFIPRMCRWAPWSKHSRLLEGWLMKRALGSSLRCLLLCTVCRDFTRDAWKCGTSVFLRRIYQRLVQMSKESKTGGSCPPRMVRFSGINSTLVTVYHGNSFKPYVTRDGIIPECDTWK